MTDNSNTEAAKLALAADYVARGWHVLVLHDIAAGECSCGNPRNDPRHDTAEGSGGKHPVAAAWGASAMGERTAVEAALAARPQANLGILTGQLSGIWVLDIDPRHDGDARLAELELAHGRIGRTYTARTGSGGWHLYFTLPDDFTPTNAKGTLPPGIDVRGQGGQVVAAPSVTHAGAYEIVDLTDPQPAPAWLLDMIRARPPVERGTGVYTPDEFTAHFGGMASTTADRLERYAAIAAAAECARLAAAVPGERGITAYKVACNLIELVNTPWAGMAEAVVRLHYERAGETAMRHGGAFNEAELDTCWESARRKIGDQQRAIPRELSGGESVILPEGVPPFPEAVIPAPRVSVESPALAMSTLPVTSGSPSGAPTLTTPGGFSGTLTTFTGSESIHLNGTASADPVDALLGELVTLDQLAALPPLEPLIEGFLSMDSAAWMIGPSGHGKSFVGLDMMLSVATGKPWNGHAVRQGLVVNLVAEGARGMGVRGLAWRGHHGADPGRNILFLPRPVQASGAEWDTLVRALARLSPVLITLDTQARISVGMEENSNSEMGVLVEQIERLRRATGACVLTVHHTGKSGLEGRGASAIKAAAQTELTVTRQGDRLTVKTTKQKDGPELAPIELRFLPVDVQIDAPQAPVLTSGPTLLTPGRHESSVVLVPWAADAGERAAMFDDELTGAQLAVAQLMADVFNQGNGGTKAEVRGQYLARYDGTRTAGTRAFLRAWNALLDKGAMARITGTTSYRWVPVDERTGPSPRHGG